jgi:hypothetical protein
MKTSRNAVHSLLAAGLGLLAGLAASTASALPDMRPSTPAFHHRAAADCHAVGQQVAAQNGGQLARATPSTQGGQPVCVIVVLVPAKDGSHPRRMEVVVPQG